MTPELLTIKQTAALLSVDRKLVYRLINDERIPVVRLSERVIRIPRALLMRRLESEATRATKPLHSELYSSVEGIDVRRILSESGQIQTGS